METHYVGYFSALLLALVLVLYGVAGVGEDIYSENYYFGNLDNTSKGPVKLIDPAKCGDRFNKFASAELVRSQAYLELEYFFESYNVSLPGLKSYFLKHSERHREWSRSVMNYMNKRAIDIKLNMTELETDNRHKMIMKSVNFASGSLGFALTAEKEAYKELDDIHKCGKTNKDAVTQNFIEGNYLAPQVDRIKFLADTMTQMRTAGINGLGLFYFDNKLNAHLSQ